MQAFIKGFGPEAIEDKPRETSRQISIPARTKLGHLWDAQ